MRTDMVLEKELRVLHLDWQQQEETVPHWAWPEHLRPQRPPLSVTRFLQQGHSYSNKTTLTPCEPMEVIFLQTITALSFICRLQGLP